MVTIEYYTKWGRKIEEAMYLFDQEAGKAHIRYCVDGGKGSRPYGYRLRIVIPKAHEGIAQEIAARLGHKARQISF